LSFLAALVSFLEKAAAAGFGAWAAFRFQAYREGRKEHDERLNAVREGLFVLASQRSFLINLSDQQLTPMRGEALRYLLLRPTIPGRAQLTLDLSKLVFLIKLHESGPLLSHLDLAEARFQTVLSLLDERRKLHESMQQRLDPLPATVETDLLEAVTRAVGRRIVISLQRATDDLYSAVADAIEENRFCTEGIQGFIRSTFPKERVPQVTEQGSAVKPQT
jgi:hypothetical protein